MCKRLPLLGIVKGRSPIASFFPAPRFREEVFCLTSFSASAIELLEDIWFAWSPSAVLSSWLLPVTEVCGSSLVSGKTLFSIVLIAKISRKHTYIILTPLKPHFYIVKLGYTLLFLFLLENIDCGYSLEPPRRGGSNKYPQSMFWAEIWKNIRDFYLKIFSI